MRKILAFVFVALLGAVGVARADASPPEKSKGGKAEKVGKVKAGGACKADADCDQSSRPLRCRESRCEPYPSHPVT